MYGIFKTPRIETIYNVTNGEELTIRKAAEYFADYMNLNRKYISFRGNRREGDSINWCADVNKLFALEYTRSISFVEGVRQYINWVRNLDQRINKI